MTHQALTIPTDSPAWYTEYRAICTKGVAEILGGRIKPPQLAAFILENFGDHLSPSAKARWQHIAGQVEA